MSTKLKRRHVSIKPKKPSKKDETNDLFEGQVRERWVEFLKQDISELDFSPQTEKELRAAKIGGIMQLVKLSEAEVLDMKLSDGSLEEIKDLFSKVGLELGKNKDFLEKILMSQEREAGLKLPKFSVNAMNSSSDIVLYIYARDWMAENNIRTAEQLLREFPELYVAIEGHMMLAHRANRAEAQIFADLLGKLLPK